MKVLYITLEDMSSHKGSVVHVREAVAALKRCGHKVALIACASTKPFPGKEFYNISCSGLFPFKLSGGNTRVSISSFFLLILSLFRLLPRYDVAYAREYHAAILAFLPCLLFRKKLVFEMNGIASEERKLKDDSRVNGFFAALIGVAEKWAVRLSDGVVSVTPQIKSRLVNDFNCDPRKTQVITNGVNTEKFYPIHDDILLGHWRRRLGLEKHDLVVTFVGNLAAWQGVESLIEVAPSVLQQIGSIKFLIVGSGVLRKKLEKQVDALGLTGNFIFTGMMNYGDIPFCINVADICVSMKTKMKSGYSPLKIYEYMACGKPIIASRVEGLEFIEAEGIGKLCEPGDLPGLRQAILYLVESPEQRFRMGKRGHEIARTRFDWGKKATEIDRTLRALA